MPLSVNAVLKWLSLLKGGRGLNETEQSHAFYLLSGNTLLRNIPHLWKLLRTWMLIAGGVTFIESFWAHTSNYLAFHWGGIHRWQQSDRQSLRKRFASYCFGLICRVITDWDAQPSPILRTRNPPPFPPKKQRLSNFNISQALNIPCRNKTCLIGIGWNFWIPFAFDHREKIPLKRNTHN